MAAKHSDVQAKRGRGFASNRLLKNRFGMPREYGSGVEGGPMGPEITVAAPTRGLGGPGRSSETPGGRAESSTGHPGGTGAARCLAMRTWSSKRPSRQFGLPSQIPDAETGPSAAACPHEDEIGHQCAGPGHRVYCGMALWKVLKILLSILGICLYPTRCAESRFCALKPAQHPG